MNLMIIGNNVDDLAKEIWSANTNYTILNECPDVTGKQFIKYIARKDVIVTTTSEQFKNRKINDCVDFFIKYNFTPILIADSKDCFESLMYSNIDELMPESLLYTRNKENKDYVELVRILKDYLLGKGIIKNDKSIRASNKRKGRPTKE